MRAKFELLIGLFFLEGQKPSHEEAKIVKHIAASSTYKPV
jgi:hypothetical protein